MRSSKLNGGVMVVGSDQLGSTSADSPLDDGSMVRECSTAGFELIVIGLILAYRTITQIIRLF